MKQLRIGVLGLSEGNGHPYSWAAIFNGYDPDAMSFCPFPVIPQYLGLQKFPEDCIPNAKVTHIWTQDRVISEDVAKASLIKNVVDNPKAMIDEVDAVLLARDDATTHYELSAPFLRAGLPVYVDKPLATNVSEAQRIYALEKYPGQVFSCSALRYSNDLTLTPELNKTIGNIKYIHATTMKYWDTYSVHIIEPTLKLMGISDSPIKVSSSSSVDRKSVCATWAEGQQAVFSTLGTTPCPIKIQVFGEKANVELLFKDTFHSFREALRSFVEGVRERREMIPRDEVLRVVELIEKGNTD